jgi:hypothetical protein
MDLFTFQARGGGGGRSSAANAAEAASVKLVFQFEVHGGLAAGAAGLFSRAADARVGAVVHAKAERKALIKAQSERRGIWTGGVVSLRTVMVTWQLRSAWGLECITHKNARYIAP